MLTSFILCGVLSFLSPPTATHKDIELPPESSLEYILDDPSLDMNHSYLSLKVTYSQEADAEAEDFYLQCINRCRGEKHLAHADCNLSCDDRCKQGFHEGTFAPRELGHGEELLTRFLNQSGRQFGVNINLGGCSQAAAKSINDAITGGKYTIKDRQTCWNEEPCSHARKGYKSTTIYANIWFSFYRNDKGADGKITRVDGPKDVIQVRSYSVADTNSPLREITPVCRCAVLQPIPEDKKHSSIGGVTTGDGSQYAMKELEKYKFDVSFTDMNKFTVTAYNPTDMTKTFEMLPGTECIPTNPAYQTMLTTEAVRFDVMPHRVASAEVPFAAVPDEPLLSFFGGRGVCINMHKKPPEAGVKYKPLGCSDGRLVALAGAAVNERFRGPWTQTRFWIVTDNATIDEVRKTLIPGPTEGMYLRSLFQASNATHLDFSSKERSKCVESRLLTGASGVRGAASWLVDTLTKIDARGLSSWISKNPNAFATLFAEKAVETDMDHAVELSCALLENSNGAVQLAGMDLLKSIPADRRAAFVEAGGLASLSSVLNSTDPKVVAKALDTAEAFAFKSLAVALYNLPKDALPDVKIRAAKIAKTLRD